MKDLAFFPLYYVLAFSVSWVSGVKIPFRRTAAPKATFGISKDLLNGVLVASNSSTSGNIGNVKDLRYTATVNLNGRDVVVALDTGSSDLWVYISGGLGSVNDTHISSGVAYGDGSYGVNGTIAIAPLEFGPYKVEKQAFLDVHQISLKGITEYGIDGLLGLGFNGTRASNIDRKIRNTYGPTATWGGPFLSNVFAQNTSTPNFIAIELARTDDLEDTSGGSFDIGEYDSRYTAIQHAPKLPQYPPGSDFWQTLLDEIKVNGESITITSGLQGAPKGKAVAALDTGTPTSAFTTKVVNQIYGAVEGAVYVSNDYGWILPCNATPNVEFSFGGQSFPMHPLDLSLPDQVTLLGKNYTACFASFITIDGWSDDYDYLLGDSFLRNTYTIYDFGDFDTTTQSTGTPYMQLLSETNYSTAAAEAISTRAKTLAGMPPELAPSELLKLIKDDEKTTSDFQPGGSGSAVDFSPASTWADFDVKKYALIIVGLLGVNTLVGMVLIVLGVLGCVRRRERAGDGGGKPQYIPVPVKMADGGQTTHAGYNGGRYDTSYQD